MLLGELAVTTPTYYQVGIKIGLTETLTFIMGFIFGPIAGFVGGSSIIIISDIAVIPGVWTPFIAAIIGCVFGIGGGLIRRLMSNPPKRVQLAVSAIILTLISEVLQNAWVSTFYGPPLIATMISGLVSLVAALINNTILLTVIGPRIISTIQEQLIASGVVKSGLD